MKFTRASLKSFIKKNEDNLFVKKKSSFDGMTDCVQAVADDFRKVEKINFEEKNTFGIKGAWFVGDGRDLFEEYEDELYKGYYIYNCCGSFIIGIKK